MKKIGTLPMLFLAMLIVAGTSIISCSSSEGGRKSSKGTPTDQSDDDEKKGLMTAQSLASCQAKGEAWIAVVDSGASPAKCDGTLVEWCCTKEEIYARFPTMHDSLDPVFEANVDTEGYILYACAQSGSDTTFHFGKIVGGATKYKNASIAGAFPQETGNDSSNCTVVTEDDLKPESETVEDPEEGVDED